MLTEVIDVRVKSLVPGPSILSFKNTAPEFPAVLWEPVVFKLAVTVVAGQGGVGPVKSAEIGSPRLTLARNCGVQTTMAAWAGVEAKAEAKPNKAEPPNVNKRDERIGLTSKSRKKYPPLMAVKRLVRRS